LNPTDDKQDWIDRIKIIESQVHDIWSMVERNQPCPELMLQISSVKASLQQLGVKIFETRLREEFQLIISLDNHAQSEHIKEILVILSRNFK